MRTVFIVDDDPELRLLMRRFIEREPGVVVVGDAESAEEALDALDVTALPDVLVVDAILPGLTGMEFVEHIRQIRPTQPVVFCSASPAFDLEDELRAAGLIDVAVAPKDDLTRLAARVSAI